MSPSKQFEQDRARGQDDPSADRLRKADRLLEIFDLESIEQDLFRGHNEVRSDVRLFGGQVLAQALRAAYHTVDGRHAHSLHAYFIRAGDGTRPVLYEVDRIRDGRSFTTRRVVAIQAGEAIFSAAISFQRAEDGFEHAHPMPNVPPPEELADDQDSAAQLAGQPNLSPLAKRVRPFAMRSIFPLGSPQWQKNRFRNPVWIRFGRSVADADQVLALSARVCIRHGAGLYRRAAAWQWPIRYSDGQPRSCAVNPPRGVDERLAALLQAYERCRWRARPRTCRLLYPRRRTRGFGFAGKVDPADLLSRYRSSK